MYMKMTVDVQVLVCATEFKAIVDIYNFPSQLHIVIFTYSQ